MRLFLAVLFVLLFAGLCQAETITFGWDPYEQPSDFAGFRLYERSDNETYQYGSDYAVATLTPAQVEAGILGPLWFNSGDHNFVLTAFDEAGNESGPSNEVRAVLVGKPGKTNLSRIRVRFTWS